MYVDSVRRVHNTKKKNAGTPIITRGDVYILPVYSGGYRVCVYTTREKAGWQHHLCLLNDGPIKSPLV